MAMKTTLNKIRKHSPCREGWEKLLKHLGKTSADDEPLDLMTILKSNGIQDTVWCLRCFEYDDYRLFNADVAESVLHIFEAVCMDDRPRKAIEAARYGDAATTTAATAAATTAAATTATTTAAAATAAINAAAAYAAYAAYAAAYAAAAAAASASAAADAAASASAAADAAASASAVAVAADARIKKWKEIEKLFIKHFGQNNE